jgi:ABC-type Zn uptake system ZnuABC Zn-binding protein ZnuA/ABC-type Mn2+/Zn2+ transport system permease subunit
LFLRTILIIVCAQMFDTLALHFVQRGLIEVAFLAVAAGVLGTWIVLRGLSFYAHAVGTAAFPGLVLADGFGFAAPLGAFGAAIAFALLLRALERGDRHGERDATTALALTAMLALGILLASDVFHTGSRVETLLFGSLLVIDGGDQALAAAAAAAAIVASTFLGRAWLARGFDADGARALGLRSDLPDALLLGLVALVSTAALSAVGALLAGSLLIVPAATTRLWTERLRTWQIATVVLAAVEGVGGLWLSVEVNAPPGAAIAVAAGTVFALAATARVFRDRRPRAAAPVAVGLAAVLLAAGLGACGSASSGSGGKLVVVATTTQLGDFARNIGADHVAVTQLLAANSDPHAYEPRPDDVRRTAAAKVVFVSGDGLDDWAKNVVKQSGSSATIVDVGAHVGQRPGSGKEKIDPHWWHDPSNAIKAVRVMADALAKADPAHAADYHRRAAAYTRKIAALDASLRKCLGAIPPAERKLVTDHDAFRYFAAHFGITVVGAVIPAVTTQAQPSAGGLADLARVIKRGHVRAVFSEQSVPRRLAEAVAAQTGARADLVLYGDTLGPKGSPGATYLGMERANADAIARGLTGDRVRCR